MQVKQSSKGIFVTKLMTLGLVPGHMIPKRRKVQ